MNIISEINQLVKLAWVPKGLKARRYFSDNQAAEDQIAAAERQQDLEAIAKARNADAAKILPRGVKPRAAMPHNGYVTSRNAPVSWENDKTIHPSRNELAWKNYASQKSTRMLANMNKTLTSDDAYAEIMRRKPGMNPAQARRLAGMVAKNYRLDAHGNWVAKWGRPARTNSMIAKAFRANPAGGGAYAASTAPAQSTKQASFKDLWGKLKGVDWKKALRGWLTRYSDPDFIGVAPMQASDRAQAVASTPSVATVAQPVGAK